MFDYKTIAVQCLSHILTTFANASAQWHSIWTRKSQHSQECKIPRRQGFCHPSVSFSHYCEKLHAWKNRQSVCHVWLLFRSSSSSSCREVKWYSENGVASMAWVAGHCIREKPAWLTYAVSSKDQHRLIVTCDLWPFKPKIKYFSGIIMEHFYVNLVILVASVFKISCEKNTDKRRWKHKYSCDCHQQWIMKTLHYNISTA